MKPLSTRPLGGDLSPRRTLARLGTAIAILVGGCQSYAPKPLSVSAHREAFLARAPDSGEVRAFADSLAQPARPAASRSALQPVSSDRAEVIALVFNADLRVARLRAGVAQASAEFAGLWQDPVVGVTYTDALESIGNPGEFFGNVAFTIPISGRLELEKERLGLAHAAALAEVAELEWDTRMRVRRAWVEWTAALRSRDAARDLLEHLDSVLTPIAAMEQAGELTRVQARLFHLERAKATAVLNQRELDVTTSRLAIDRLLGLPPTARVELVPAAFAAPLASAIDGDRDALLRSPRLLTARTEYEVAEKRLEQEVRSQIPDIGITPGYGTENGLKQFNLGLYLPIPIFNANRQAIAVAGAERESMRTAVEQAIEMLLADLAFARARAEAAVRQREIVEERLIPLAEVQYSELRELARLGEVDPLVLVDGINQQFEAKVGLVDARRGETLAAIDLVDLVGPPEKGAMSGPSTEGTSR